MTWGIVTAEQLTRHLLSSLAHNEIAAICVPDFISASLNSTILQRIRTSGFEIYADEPGMAKIGVVQGEYIHGDAARHVYFSLVERAIAARSSIIQHDIDPLYEIMQALSLSWGYEAEIAFEQNLHQRYFAGLIRLINRSLMHFDWAPHDAKGWAIEHICVQFACNIYLQTDNGGGVTRIYRRPWSDKDEIYRQPGSYAYALSIVDGCEYVEYAPTTRSLLLFNSRNYHEVLSTVADFQRISMSSFVGLHEDPPRLVFWS